VAAAEAEGLEALVIIGRAALEVAAVLLEQKYF